MEYRKLISFGKNSFVVSLPKAWVVQNNLVKGDLIYIDESGPKLVLSKKEHDKPDLESEKVILIDGKSNSTIAREVCSAYILNFRTITLKGKEIRSKVKDLQGIIQGLIALEIMEQTSESIVAKDFLNMEKVSLRELIRKMDVVTRTMLKESCSIFEDDNYENINERDKDVNRLYFLLYRATLFNMQNPMKAMKNFKLTPMDMLQIHYQSFYLEAIADEVRRAARFLRKLKLSPALKKELKDFINNVNDYYLETIKAVHNRDSALALQLSEKKKGFDEELNKFEVEVPKVIHLNRALNRLRRMITCVHNLGRITYTLV